MPKWELRRDPELMPEPLTEERYNQLVAEIGELMYDYFCQLDSRTNFPVNISTDAEGSAPFENERRA